MTLSEIRNQIFSHFLTDDHFSVKDHINKINVPESLSTVKNTVILAALADLEKIDLVTKLSSDKWILRSPLNTISQAVQISGQTAEVIADFINSYRDANKIKGDLCSKLQISERDIANLLQIAHTLLNTDDKDREFGNN